MEAASIYVKTPYGRAEVHSRARQLSPRERATLIMIDGRRCLDELRRLSPAPHELEQHLQSLLEAGLIAPLSSSSKTASATGTAANYDPTGSATAIIDQDLDRARRYIKEVAQETLGTDAARFTCQLDQLTNAQEFLSLAHHLRDALRRLTNVKEAEQFWETIREVVPRT